MILGTHSLPMYSSLVMVCTVPLAMVRVELVAQ